MSIAAALSRALSPLASVAAVFDRAPAALARENAEALMSACNDERAKFRAAFFVWGMRSTVSHGW
jgi:hypothetical protein